MGHTFLLAKLVVFENHAFLLANLLFFYKIVPFY